jgi:hypothetical protein
MDVLSGAETTGKQRFYELFFSVSNGFVVCADYRCGIDDCPSLAVNQAKPHRRLSEYDFQELKANIRELGAH